MEIMKETKTFFLKGVKKIGKVKLIKRKRKKTQMINIMERYDITVNLQILIGQILEHSCSNEVTNWKKRVMN